MNLTTRLTLTAALAFTCMAGAAQTIERIDTPAFSMVNPWGAAPDTLLYDANGLTRIALNGAAGSLGAATSQYIDGNFYGGLFEVTVHAGYRVTGFSFSGTFEGVLAVPVNPDGSPGDGSAYNSGYVEFSAGSRPYGLFYDEHTQRVDMLDGAIAVDMSSGQLDLRTDFNLSLQGMILVSAYPTVTPQHPEGIDSFASLRLRDPVFTIYTSAVPEPASCAMLMAGIAVLRALGSRAQRHADDCSHSATKFPGV